jgi:hypothetical protein
VNCLPHSHPKKILSEHRTKSGPSSTVLSPHSLHMRMTLLEEPFTCQPPSSVVLAMANVACPRDRHNVNLFRAAALRSTAPSVHVARAGRQGLAASTCRSARATYQAELRIHLYLDHNVCHADGVPDRHTSGQKNAQTLTPDRNVKAFREAYSGR